MTTPVPPHLSDEERALWGKADAARQAMEAVTQPFTLTTTAHDRGLWSLLGEGEYTAANALCQLAHACNPAVILSLLTALSTEREAGEQAREDASGLRDALALVVDAWDTTGLGYQAKREAKRALAALDAIAADADSEIARLRALCAAPSTETPHAD